MGWVVLIAVLLALLGALSWAFGPGMLGLPAMIVILVLVAGLQIAGHAGVSGFLFVVFAAVVVLLVIGMAMSLGPERRRRPPPPPQEPPQGR